MKTIKPFKYVDELDCFIINDEFANLAARLGLQEWSSVVWLGRYFALDNDYGEHWFDNWDEREVITKKAKQLGLPYADEDLLIIVPKRFSNGYDGPCHTDEMRKKFWTEVLKSLSFSYEFLFTEAMDTYQKYKQHDEKAFNPSEQIKLISESLKNINISHRIKQKVYTVYVQLTCVWGKGAGQKFKPEKIKEFNQLWKARLYKWWTEMNDNRWAKEYWIEEGYAND